MTNPAKFIPRSDFLAFSPPNITEAEIQAVVDVLRSGWLSTGAKTSQFADEFAQFVNAEAALGLNSCTGAMHVALAALGIGPGDEVITTTMTFAASVNVIEHVGSKPILVDIDPETMNLNPEQLAAAIGPRTKAILPVHFAGQAAEMSLIMELARQHHLYVIEDAAHALPSSYEGQMVGSIGDLTAFSFYATKNLTTGEGGMLTGKKEYIERAKLFALHGMNRDAWKRYSSSGTWYYEILEAGFKYNMTDIQAAMGLVQMQRLSEMQERRYEIVHRYNEAFSQLKALQVPIARKNVQHAWHLYVLRLNLETLTINRARFIEELKARNVGASVHFIPVHMHPYYAKKYGFKPESFPIAYSEYQRTVSLPLHSALNDEDLDYIIAAVQDIVRQYER
jgi:dTDP-4-amino-4,6-dideoxygalactose transaminase